MMKKKILAATCAAVALQLGSALPVTPWEAACAPSPVLAVPVAEAAASWHEDIEEATKDDTMAFGIYIGKPLQTFIDDFTSKGWQRNNNYGKTIAFQKDRGAYLIAVVVHPHENNKNLVGNYDIRFHIKDRNTADEMYMMAEKNFSYNFGRPNVKRGNDNRVWFINDTFSLLIEYNEYDPRMSLVKNFPYEVVVKRQTGDFKRFFQAKQ